MRIVTGYKINANEFCTIVVGSEDEAFKVLSQEPYKAMVYGTWLVISKETEMIDHNDVIYLDPKAGELRVHLFEARIPRSLYFVGKFYVLSQERESNSFLRKLCATKGIEPFQMEMNKDFAVLEQAKEMGFRPWVQCPDFSN